MTNIKMHSTTKVEHKEITYGTVQLDLSAITCAGGSIEYQDENHIVFKFPSFHFPILNDDVTKQANAAGISNDMLEQAAEEFYRSLSRQYLGKFVR